MSMRAIHRVAMRAPGVALRRASAVAAEVPQQLPLLIDGKEVPSVSGKTFENINPATLEILGTVAEGDQADIDLAVAAARRAFDDGPWPKMSGRERSKILHRFADLVEQNAEELAYLESLDNGKTVALAAAADIPLVVDHLRYFAGWADKIHGQTIPVSDGNLTYTLLEPIGVCGAIIPWNFPMLMMAWKMAPCLAAGNTMVIKTAEQTPLTALRGAQLALEAGIPPGVLNVVSGFGETAGQALARHMDVDKIGFTGSTEVGKLILEAAAQTNLKRVSLELGGKSPLIVCEDADIDTALFCAHMGLFLNNGQCCVAASRLYVHEAIYERFVQAAAEMAAAQKVGDPLAAGTDQGPLVSEEQMNRVLGYITAGKEAGARVLTGGGRAPGLDGYFVQPTVFADVTEDMTIAREEIFGPVMSAIKFSDYDDVLRRANDNPYGLAAGVCTSSHERANSISRALRAGTVWVNTWNQFDAAAPFGGFKMSGHGRDKGQDALANWCEVKTVTTPLKNPSWR